MAQSRFDRSTSVMAINPMRLAAVDLTPSLDVSGVRRDPVGRRRPDGNGRGLRESVRTSNRGRNSNGRRGGGGVT
jgi:hypothetical protein